jgi:hypothetical protein
MMLSAYEAVVFILGKGAGYDVERSNRKKGRVGVLKSVPRAGSRTVI